MWANVYSGPFFDLYKLWRAAQRRSVCNSGSISPHWRRLISPCCGTVLIARCIRHWRRSQTHTLQCWFWFGAKMAALANAHPTKAPSERELPTKSGEGECENYRFTLTNCTRTIHSGSSGSPSRRCTAPAPSRGGLGGGQLVCANFDGSRDGSPTYTNLVRAGDGGRVGRGFTPAAKRFA